MKKQQQRARDARNAEESMSSQKPDLMAFEEVSEFDYDPTPIVSKVIGLFKDGVKTDIIEDEGEIILDKTTFYAEMGGQCGDTGAMENDLTQIVVKDVVNAPNKQHLHIIKVEKGAVKLGDELTLKVDLNKRKCITANHTATHLLQKVLQDTLGSHVSQAGSYVDSERLRFDFTHFEKIDNSTLKEIEMAVNDAIFKGMGVDIQSMSIEEAMKSGAMALFTDKYGDVVRVVNVGNYSIELCGGCHVHNSSEIGLFKIVGEESIGSGVRRIEALTGKAAYLSMYKEKETVEEITSLLKLKNSKEVVFKIEGSLNKIKELEKEVEKLNAKMNSLQAASLMDNAVEINGIKVLYVQEDIEPAKAKSKVFDYRDQIGSGIIVLVSTFEEKVSYFVALSKDVVEKGYKAGVIIKKINEVVDGRGGGKPDFAQGGCKVSDQLSKIEGAIKLAL